MTGNAEAYWLRTRRLTFALVICWLLVTFGITWFARDINEMTILGFPLGFYMAAQGAPVIYLAIIWWYNRQMKKIDAEFGVEDD
jgi:putative solute:sodium symporter small subunit